jgi:hypothetical protein
VFDESIWAAQRTPEKINSATSTNIDFVMFIVALPFESSKKGFETIRQRL